MKALKYIVLLLGMLAIFGMYVKFVQPVGATVNMYGTIRKWTGLWESKNVVVQRNVMSKGSCFELHKHEQSEILIVISGSLKVNKQIYSAGEIIRFEPNEPHSVYAIETTEIIAVLIPWGKGYPNAR